jgi:RNA polymerase sigma-70 factor (ECF subfamily)
MIVLGESQVRLSGCAIAGARRTDTAAAIRMNTTPVSLLKRVTNPGDQESWREFVGLYEPLLFRYVCRQGLDENDARDVVQEILVILLRKLPTFQFDPQRGRFRTWLWQIASNCARNYLRKRRRATRAESEKQHMDSSSEPDEDWLRYHRQRLLQFALEEVRKETAPRTWDCFEQHVVRGRAAAQIAEELGVKANSVYVNASRVLAQIRQRCASYEGELGDD